MNHRVVTIYSGGHEHEIPKFKTSISFSGSYLRPYIFWKRRLLGSTKFMLAIRHTATTWRVHGLTLRKNIYINKSGSSISIAERKGKNKIKILKRQAICTCPHLIPYPKTKLIFETNILAPILYLLDHLLSGVCGDGVCKNGLRSIDCLFRVDSGPKLRWENWWINLLNKSWFPLWKGWRRARSIGIKNWQ